MPQLLVQITEEQAAWLDSQCDRFSPKARLIRDLIDSARQGLTRGVDYAPTVSVRDTELTSASTQAEEPQQVHNSLKESSAATSEARTTVLLPVEETKKNSFVSSVRSIGEGVGMGSGETPRKDLSDRRNALGVKRTKLSSSREIKPELQCHEDLIRQFWSCKAGAKSDMAWSFFMTELGKLQAKHGDRVLRDQLELAAASRWKSVTLKNYEQFGLSQTKQSYGKPQAKSLTEQARELGLF
jgi:hypothetical protein